MKLTMKKASALITLSLVTSYSIAENYQYEGFLGFSDGEVDTPIGSGDTESFNLGFTANFSEVDTSKGPLAEASFLDRASSVSVEYSDGEIEDIDTNSISGALRLVGKESGFTGELIISDSEIDDVDSESLGLSVGYYVAENTEIGLAYVDTEVEDIDSDSILIGVKHVATGETAFSVQAAIGTVEIGDDDDTVITVGGTLYPTSQLGIGASYTTIDSDIDNDTYELFADWFITPAAAVTLSYSDSEVGSIESDELSLTGRVRF